MVAVLGVSESSRASLMATLDQLGTNLLTVSPGQSVFGEDATIPTTAAVTVPAIEGVSSSAASYNLDGQVVRKSDLIPEEETNAIGLSAVSLNLPRTVGAELADGRYFGRAGSGLPQVVLGATAASRLGITRVVPGLQVLIGDQLFTVVGILEPSELVAELDSRALIGVPVAERLFDDELELSDLYVRTDPGMIDQVRELIPRTADPENPEEVEVSRPSDALEAQAAADTAFTSLFLGLGAVALLVGGVGIANVMVISVLERRTEIGLRRAIGATRRHITAQFLTEALILSLLGAIGGLLLGSLATIGYAMSQGWQVVIPLVALVGACLAALMIGAIAGMYPAVRAARISPTEALRSA
jgi:putative ABC transport system permease protein